MNKARFTAPTCIILGDPDIGEGTWLGHYSILDGANAKLTIGKNCSIASGVHIYTHSTHELTTQGTPKKTGSVEIGDNVAIGANSVVMYDVTIGNNICIPALTVIKPHMKIETNDKHENKS